MPPSIICGLTLDDNWVSGSTAASNDQPPPDKLSGSRFRWRYL